MPASEELNAALRLVNVRQGIVRMTRAKYRDALKELHEAERALEHAQKFESYRQTKIRKQQKLDELHQKIADLRACPYCTAPKGELCWNASAYLYGKEEKAWMAHAERGYPDSPQIRGKYGPRDPIKKFGFYNGWDPYGIK